MSKRANLIRIGTPLATELRTDGLDRLGRAGPRTFPLASEPPDLPTVIRDELLDLYAFIFCQHGFHQLGMTFEQFLLVVTTVRPGELDASFRRSAA
jgi:hypothetical protein